MRHLLSSTVRCTALGDLYCTALLSSTVHCTALGALRQTLANKDSPPRTVTHTRAHTHALSHTHHTRTHTRNILHCNPLHLLHCRRDAALYCAILNCFWEASAHNTAFTVAGARYCITVYCDGGPRLQSSNLAIECSVLDLSLIHISEPTRPY